MTMKVKIIGYGVSGKAAENYLNSKGVKTLVVNRAEEKVAEDYDFCVVSPGVPMEQVHLETVPVVPEVELPFFYDHKIKPRCLVAVTGTNGKTTVVNQIYRMCTLAKKKSVLCGNVGIPVSSVAAKISGAITVIEVSSFMLEQTKVLHPNIAVITNITADHLDRHCNMETYIQCKARIIAQQKRHDVLVVNWDDENARRVGQEVEQLKLTKVIWYSTKNIVRGYYVINGQVWEKLGRREKIIGSANALGSMSHSLSNALAVIAVGRRLRLPLSKICQACQYQSQPHRMELVADTHGVIFYNDSKATNMAATLAAVSAVKIPVCLILCGLSKGQDYHELLEQLPVHVVQVLVFGTIQNQVMTIAKSMGLKNVKAVMDLTSAVKYAVSVVPRPGVVLFSPSGSSFDQFNNYEHRGEEFRRVVKNIIGQVPQSEHQVDANL